MTTHSEASVSSTKGYRKKPFWIYLMAGIFIVTPLCNHLLTLFYLGVPDWYLPRVWVASLKFVSTPSWIVSTLILSSGISLFFVRKWALWLTLASLLALLIYTLVRFDVFWKMGPVVLLASLFSTGGVFSLLYFSRFRQPYIDPRIRWWESSPRYRVSIPVKFDEAEIEAQLVDISRTGALVEWDLESSIPVLPPETMMTLQENFCIPCRVARKTVAGYGLEFSKLDSDEKKSLARFIQNLQKDPSKLRR